MGPVSLVLSVSKFVVERVINVTDHRPDDVMKWSPCLRTTSVFDVSDDIGIRKGVSSDLEGRTQLPVSISWKTDKVA